MAAEDSASLIEAKDTAPSLLQAEVTAPLSEAKDTAAEVRCGNGRLILSIVGLSALLLGCAGIVASSKQSGSLPSAKVRDVVSFAESPASKMGVTVLETAVEARDLKTYDAITDAVQGLMRKLPTDCTDSACPKGEWAACILRLAGHDFMDFDHTNNAGGSDGCVDFTDPDNNGLEPCMLTGENDVKLQDAWDQFRDTVSLADFFVIAAEAVMVETRGDLQPSLDFRSNFVWGRRTVEDCSGQIRLPDPQDGCHAVEDTFVTSLGLSWRETAALMGVHTLGRARVENSGFDGWWSDPSNAEIFNNNYYLSILLKGWAPEKVGDKSQWKRIGEGQEHSRQMMLNTDICLAYGDSADKAEEDNCCAWIMPDIYEDGGAAAITLLREHEKSFDDTDHWCGFDLAPHRGIGGPWTRQFGLVQKWCCVDGGTEGPRGDNGRIIDCGNPSDLTGNAAKDIIEFSTDEKAWIEVFMEAWKKATEINMVAAATI